MNYKSGTYVERSDNVINERSLWTFIERPRGNIVWTLDCDVRTTFI